MKFSFSKEILCLIFIITSSIMLGKVLFEVKTSVNENVDKIYSHTEHLSYHVSSYKPNEKISDLEEINVIRNVDDLKKIKMSLEEKKINLPWLNSKLDKYGDDSFYEESTLVVLCLNNSGTNIANRVTDIIKEDNDVTIKIDKSTHDSDIEYSWIAVVEIEDVDSNISLRFNKI